MSLDYSRVARNPHAFRVHDTQWEGHQLTGVAVESQEYFFQYGGLHPPDWQQQIAGQMDRAGEVFVEYVPEDIVRNVGSIPFVNLLAERYVDRDMIVYSRVAKIAAALGKPLRTASIATRLAFLRYESRQEVRTDPRYRPKVLPGEQDKPAVVDARRTFTARAIRQVAAQHSDGVSALYIAAPAHVNRVLPYVTQQPTPASEAIFQDYSHRYRRLDQTVRTYEYLRGLWRLSDVEDIV